MAGLLGRLRTTAEKYFLRIRIHSLELALEPGLPLTITWKKHKPGKGNKSSTTQTLYSAAGEVQVDEEIAETMTLYRKPKGNYAKKTLKLEITTLRHEKKQVVGRAKIPIKDLSVFPVSQTAYPLKSHDDKHAQIWLSISLDQQFAETPPESPSEEVRETIFQLEQELEASAKELSLARASSLLSPEYTELLQQKEKLTKDNADLLNLLTAKQEELHRVKLNHQETLDKLQTEKHQLEARVQQLEAQKPRAAMKDASDPLNSELDRMTEHMDTLLEQVRSSNKFK